MTVSPEDRLIARLMARKDFTSGDIGAEIGMSAPAVRKRWQRIRERAIEFWNLPGGESEKDGGS
jgi:biotin operon repressor